MDEPVDRSAHKTMVPRLGGLGLFITFCLTLIIFSLLFDLKLSDVIKINSLIASSIILVFLGVKDDLVFMAPKKKLIGQLIAVGLVIFLADVRITSFEGLLGIGELPYLFSVIFTFFVFILVINAINLIDGIDGLAGSMAILASTAFGVFFLINGYFMMTLVSFILIGALSGFLTYNFSSTRKIFMGDCGSMFVGFLLAFQGTIFLTYNTAGNLSYYLSNAPILLLAILSFPLLDTLRVFAIRIKEKRSPFSADRNHIHHRLLDLGFGHKQATLFLLACSTLTISTAILVRPLNMHLQLLLIVLVGSALYLSPFSTVFKKARDLDPFVKKQNSKRQAIKNVVVNGRVQKQKEPLTPKEQYVYMEPKPRFGSVSHQEMHSDEENSEIPKFLKDRSAILKESITSKKQNTKT